MSDTPSPFQAAVERWCLDLPARRRPPALNLLQRLGLQPETTRRDYALAQAAR